MANEYDCKAVQHVRDLVSIEFVRVNKIDDGKPGQLYGTVIVTNFWGVNIVVYHRPSVKSETKGPGEYLSLTGPGPGREINGDGTAIISVNVWMLLRDHDDSEITKQIAKGEVVFDPQTDTSSYDKPLQEDLLGEHGSVTLGYSVMKDAVSATIDVVMMNESPAQIYGTIKAVRFLGESSSTGSSTTRMLFDKSASEWVTVNPQQSIPLTRPNFPVSIFPIPVPVNTYLTIEADLWDSSGDQILLDSVQFNPIFSTQKKSITGKYGQVQISVTCE